MKFLHGLASASPFVAIVILVLQAPAALALNESQRIKANDAASNDNFGFSVGISGGVAIVGSFNDDDTAQNSGSAYIFRNPGSGTWSQLDKLNASDAALDDNFGTAVAISGNTAIVSAPFDDGRGSAYIFRDNGAGDWLQLDKLLANDGASGDQFGSSVAISGNTAVVGAYYDNGKIGSAYVFRDNGAGDWMQIAKLTADDGAANDEFGNSVAVFGNTVLVGAHLDSNAGGGAAGAVYVFQDNGDTWSQVDKLMAADGSVFKQFGSSVSLSSNTALIGASGDGTFGLLSGAAYVFQRDGLLVWQQMDKLTASDGNAGDLFGSSVALSGNTAVVGASAESDGGAGAGAAYSFRDNGLGNWNQFAKLRASDAQSGDSLGTAVGISGTTALVGAPLANSPTDSGAGYLYTLVAGLAGDFNGDGNVNAADFVVWRNTAGQAGSGLPADGNGDGAVNQADYQLWRENFGLSASGDASNTTATAVPEPATAALLCLAVGLFGYRNRRRS